jgi:DNA-binding XRE family transcriptional regulator
MRDQRQISRAALNWRMPVERWRRNGSGYFVDWPVPEMVVVGARFRHGRRQKGWSQRRLALEAGVSQSVISRFERGLVTGMSTERLIRLATALGPRFPFGFCPHEHACKWPYDPAAEPTLADLFRP